MNATATTPNQDQLLTICKAAADTLRLDVLRALSAESFGVLELCHIFEMPQPGMSHHLKILATADLLSTRREGNSIFYRRALVSNQDSLEPLIRSLFQSIDQTRLDPKVTKRIESVHKTRALSSQDFFERNADQLKENQDLIAAYHHYSGCIQDLVSNEQFPDDATVIEVGSGESELINQLASQFNQVIAVDNSPGMLSKAKNALQDKHQKRVQFILGDAEQQLPSHIQPDLIVLNMVLHHMASPANFFQIATKHLAPGGRLLIIDLCSHDQDWAREICGDLWLGFDPSDLDNWALEAKLHKGQSAYLGLKNGFQVQVRLFHSH